MRRAAKVDANHAAIREALRKSGWHVEDTSAVGNGFPDLVAIRFGQVEFIEVKDGAKVKSARRLTAREEVVALKFAAAGKRVRVIETIEQAVNL
jgi:hypothetical protein